jgi:hypothetical protein
MTQIPAKALNVDRLGNQYLVTVQVGHEKYAGTFDRLYFGENKPHLGSYRHGWLDLVYHQNQDLKAGGSYSRCGRFSKASKLSPQAWKPKTGVRH